MRNFETRPVHTVSDSTSLLLQSLLALLWVITLTPCARGDRVDAVPARDFLDSLGVCTHIGQSVDDAARAAPALAYAGISNVRDDASASHVKDWIFVHEKADVRVVLTRSGPGDSAIPALIGMSKQLAAAGALLAMEGPNEPNNWAVTFKSQRSKANSTFLPVAGWQAAFYAAVKSDSELKNYPVFHSSEAGGSEPDNVGLQFLTIPNGAGTLVPDGTRFADFANVHNYICRQPHIIDNMAWVNADPLFHGWTDGIFVEYGKTWRKGFEGYSSTELARLPRVTTETGWVTGGSKGLTQEQQGRLYLNLYLAQFKQGFRYTFVYMLRDGGGSDSGYGIVDKDYRPKRSATYLHNLTSILADRGRPKGEQWLGYTIQNPPPTVHDLLLCKSDGTFELIVWNERASGSDDVAVELEETRTSVKIYDPVNGTTPIQVLGNTRSIVLKLSDHPVVVEMIGVRP